MQRLTVAVGSLCSSFSIISRGLSFGYPLLHHLAALPSGIVDISHHHHYPSSFAAISFCLLLSRLGFFPGSVFILCLFFLAKISSLACPLVAKLVPIYYLHYTGVGAGLCLHQSLPHLFYLVFYLVLRYLGVVCLLLYILFSLCLY
ncbi:hypothetical protein QBC37DRAFT_143223 [Rhypophila decipiens]|uniref:Uncharacterized protein n=1 Tax=Rhypophila decipiens TaxID=261697 RepID=A0AAN6YA80_9PEZI|nr:hypothetical protein QBC37DRAFT_143223 [Rhypophila decipiens]